MEIKIAHNTPEFTLNMSSTLNQDANDESWGIRNLEIVANYVGDNYYLVTEDFSKNIFNENSSGWILSMAILDFYAKCVND